MTAAIVAGALASKPRNGGNAWTRLSWIRGLARLGYDVWFAEEIDVLGGDAVEFFDHVVEQFGLGGRASLMCGGDCHGARFDDLRSFAADADLLVNIGGHLTTPELTRAVRTRVYFDDDPGFTQLWQAAGITGARFEGHDAYYTLGANIGRPGCTIPTAGLPWRPLRPPVVLDDWPMVGGVGLDRFTTIASWRGPYGPVEHGGQTLKLKAHEFRKLADLPATLPHRFEIALQIDADDAADVELLQRGGWSLALPSAVAGTPEAFRAYVQESDAEFSVAQGMYVQTRCGWFSDRTTRYLASGKPVIVQETGFCDSVPVGRGLLSFSSASQARAAVVAIGSDYAAHSSAARELAEQYFDSDLVLGRMLEEVQAP